MRKERAAWELGGYVPRATVLDKGCHASVLLVGHSKDGQLGEAGLGQNFDPNLLGEVGVGRRSEFAQGVRPPVLGAGDAINREELKKREQRVYLIQILLHDGVLGLITAKDLVSNELRVTLSLKSSGAESVCNLKTSDKGFVFGLIIGGREVEAQGVSDFNAGRINDEKTSAGTLNARSAVDEE